MKNFVTVVLVLVAACSCSNASYYFKQKSLKHCDLSVTNYAYYEALPFSQTVEYKAHGDFVFFNLTQCSKTGECKTLYYSLYRPDLADPSVDQNTKLFNVTVSPQTVCDVEDVPFERTPDIHESFDFTGYYEFREETVFHGIKCFKFYNSSEASSGSSSGHIVLRGAFYGDDTTGEVFGFSFDGIVDVVVKISTPTYKPSDFTLRGIHDCSHGSMDEPDKVSWKQTCKRYPSGL